MAINDVAGERMYHVRDIYRKFLWLWSLTSWSSTFTAL